MSRFAYMSLGFVSLLAGCGSLGLYHQAGVAVSRMQSDLTNCQVEAVQKAPVATQIRYTPRRYERVRDCDAKGQNCETRLVWVGGEPYTVDPNKDLRQRVEAQCMARKGYTWVDLPRCSDDIAASVVPRSTQVMPTLSQASCAIRHGEGHWQIVTP